MRAVLVGVLAAVAVAAPARADLQTRGGVSDIALDGQGVAVGVRATSSLCDRLVVWNAVRGSAVTVSKPEPSPTCPRNRANGGIGPVALAGTRAAWVVGFGGNTEFTSRLETGTTAAPRKERTVAAATSNPETGTGGFLGWLVGAGPLLAFNSWRAVAGAPATGRLARINPASTTTLELGVGALAAAATDGSRIAIRRAGGTVALVSAAGRLQRVLDPGATARAVAIDGGLVAVQVPGNRVVLFSAATGAARDTLTLHGGAASGLDLAGNRLVYRTYKEVRALRIDTGLDVPLARTTRAVVDAEIDARCGVVYAWNGFESGFSRGHVRRIPLAAVDRALNPGR